MHVTQQAVTILAHRCVCHVITWSYNIYFCCLYIWKWPTFSCLYGRSTANERISQNVIFRQAVCTNAHSDIDSFGAL